MSWRVGIQPDFVADGIAVYMGQRLDSGLFMVKPIQFAMERIEPQTMSEPALRISDDLGRALLDSLALHYGGAVDARTSREDMLAERKRADRLIDAVITIATQAGPR